MKLPHGFIFVLTDPERLKLFSDEHKETIKHLLNAKKNDLIFVQAMIEIHSLFQIKNASLNRFLGIDKDDYPNAHYYYQWRIFLFSLIISVSLYQKDNLLEWKKRISNLIQIKEDIKAQSTVLEELLYKMHHDCTKGDVRVFPDLSDCIESVNKIYDLADDYTPTHDYRPKHINASEEYNYIHIKTPKKVTPFTPFISVFFDYIFNDIFYNFLSPDLKTISDSVWCDVLNFSAKLSNSKFISVKNIRDAKPKLLKNR